MFFSFFFLFFRPGSHPEFHAGRRSCCGNSSWIYAVAIRFFDRGFLLWHHIHDGLHLFLSKSYPSDESQKFLLPDCDLSCHLCFINYWLNSIHLNKNIVTVIIVINISFVSTPQPFLEEKLKIQDTCGIHNLHAMPGVIGGIVGAISAAAATNTVYGDLGSVNTEK